MIKKNNVCLKNYNTFHINSFSKNFYVPQSELEIKELLGELNGKKYYILSGGSNVLLRDDIEYENIIYMSDVDKSKKLLKDGKFYIGASNRIQEVINFINSEGYGGFEELYCLPAFFGGIVYMNAGIGRKFNISDFILKVKVLNLENQNIEWINKDECEFNYRKSIFQNNHYIILGAEIKVCKQEKNISQKRIEERIKFVKSKQEFGKGCFGTCFSKSNGRILKLAKLIKSKCGEVSFGKTNSNWFVNNGNGTYKETLKLINLCILLHKLCFRKIELEVRIFK